MTTPGTNPFRPHLSRPACALMLALLAGLLARPAVASDQPPGALPAAPALTEGSGMVPGSTADPGAVPADAYQPDELAAINQRLAAFDLSRGTPKTQMRAASPKLLDCGPVSELSRPSASAF